MERLNQSEGAVSVAQPRFSGRSHGTVKCEVERTFH